MNIAIISYYKSDFDSLVAELVENEGFASDNTFVRIKEAKNIPIGMEFDHVIVEPVSTDIFSYADLEKLKSQIPLKKEKFSNETTPAEETPPVEPERRDFFEGGELENRPVNGIK